MEEKKEKKPFVKRRKPFDPKKNQKTLNRKIRDFEYNKRQNGIEAMLKKHKTRIAFVVYNAKAEYQIVEIFASYQRAEDYCIKECHPWGEKGGLQIRKVFLPEVEKRN